jgi:hypothetical protein
MREADETAIVAGQPTDLQGDRVRGDQSGGGHPHQSDNCPRSAAHTGARRRAQCGERGSEGQPRRAQVARGLRVGPGPPRATNDRARAIKAVGVPRDEALARGSAGRVRYGGSRSTAYECGSRAPRRRAPARALSPRPARARGSVRGWSELTPVPRGIGVCRLRVLRGDGADTPPTRVSCCSLRQTRTPGAARGVRRQARNCRYPSSRPRASEPIQTESSFRVSRAVVVAGGEEPERPHRTFWCRTPTRMALSFGATDRGCPARRGNRPSICIDARRRTAENRLDQRRLYGEEDG